MSAIDDLPPLREVIRRHGLQARKKSLGQNFLLDLNLTARIARAAGPLEGVDRRRDRSRTGRTDARTARRRARGVSIAIERDDRALAALAEIAARYPGRLEIVAADALDYDPRPHLRWRAGAHRRQPALQYRDRTSGALAHLSSRGRPGTNAWC